jgi:hypothetical protein
MSPAAMTQQILALSLRGVLSGLRKFLQFESNHLSVLMYIPCPAADTANVLVNNGF